MKSLILILLIITSKPKVNYSAKELKSKGIKTYTISTLKR